MNAGTYSVTEPAVDGYATSYSNCDHIVIPNGGTATCTITNDDKPAHLIVHKVVVNDNGGTATADHFSFSVNGGQASALRGRRPERPRGRSRHVHGHGACDRRLHDELLQLRPRRHPDRRLRHLHDHEQRRASGQGLDLGLEVGQPTTIEGAGRPGRLLGPVTNTSLDVNVAIRTSSTTSSATWTTTGATAASTFRSTSLRVKVQLHVLQADHRRRRHDAREHGDGDGSGRERQLGLRLGRRPRGDHRAAHRPRDPEGRELADSAQRHRQLHAQGHQQGTGRRRRTSSSPIRLPRGSAT